MTRTTARITIALAVMFALTAGTGFVAATGNEKPVKKCQKYKYKIKHKPPGNPSNAQYITVGSWSAVKAHKAHGDKFLGKKCVKYKKSGDKRHDKRDKRHGKQY